MSGHCLSTKLKDNIFTLTMFEECFGVILLGTYGFSDIIFSNISTCICNSSYAEARVVEDKSGLDLVIQFAPSHPCSVACFVNSTLLPLCLVYFFRKDLPHSAPS